MRVMFAPYSDKLNSYQRHLKEALYQHGVHILPAPLGYRSFFRSPALKSSDIIHFHWYERYIAGQTTAAALLRALYFYTGLLLLKRTKKFVWTVHNFYSHERKYSWVERIFLRRFIKMMDGFSVHNEYSSNVLQSKFNVQANRIFYIPHATYSNEFGSVIGKELPELAPTKERSKLSIGLIGNIRPYKGVAELINVFREMELPDSELILAGAVNSNSDLRTLSALVAEQSNITLIPRYLSTGEMQSLFSRLDVLVFPYKDIITSGALMLGMGQGKICVASNVGSMPEFLTNDYLFSTMSDLKNILLRLYSTTRSDREEIAKLNKYRVSQFSWAYMAEGTLEMYNQILAKAGSKSSTRTVAK